MIQPCPNPDVLDEAEGTFSIRLDLSGDLAPRSEELIGYPLPPDLAKAVPRRRSEYIAGRYCAREALRLAGLPGAWAPEGSDRLPVWPEGFVGSITHKAGFVSAAVARSLLGIGIDSERLMTDEEGTRLSHAISLPGERNRAPDLEPGVFFTLLFSAKESLFKAIYPAGRVFFGFHEAELVAIDLTARKFRLKLLKDVLATHLSGAEVEGRFERADGFLHTGVELSR